MGVGVGAGEDIVVVKKKMPRMNASVAAETLVVFMFEC